MEDDANNDSTCKTQQPSYAHSHGQKASAKKQQRPPAGGRFLTSGQQDVFSHNAWDNAEWTTEMQDRAVGICRTHMQGRMSESDRSALLSDMDGRWDAFYATHDNKFFKERNWLATEFPELFGAGAGGGDVAACGRQGGATESSHVATGTGVEAPRIETLHQEGSPFLVLEAGCGNGSTVFPLLKSLPPSSPVFLYCCDYAPKAVQTVVANPLYDPTRCSCFVWDIREPLTADRTEEESQGKQAPRTKEVDSEEEQNRSRMPAVGSLDVICLIFVLSAVEPARMVRVLRRLSQLLKPGGVILFRDYGRFDLTQLRFKAHRCLAENLYSRGDGTLVYFFDQTEVEDMMARAGLVCTQSLVDRRLIVNRATRVQMHRVWIQGKFVKPLEEME